MRAPVVAAAAALLVLALTVAACGDDATPTQQIARACAGATSGATALHGRGNDVAKRVQAAEQAAATAAHALPQGNADDPKDREAEAVRALLAQSLRLRLVRSQIERGSSPGVVLEAASAWLTAGDRQTRDRLTAAGVSC